MAVFAKALGFLVAVLTLSCGGAELAKPLPILGEAPSFRLTERARKTVSAADLRGSPWVANFIFTRCVGPCPVLSLHMQRLQNASAEFAALRLVSFSVDPLTDTPEVLSEYADSFGADPRRWLFLTGERDELYTLIQDGFKLAVVDQRDEDHSMHDAAPEDVITHSTRFVLVDAGGKIRGYYNGVEPDVVDTLMMDLRRLAAE